MSTEAELLNQLNIERKSHTTEISISGGSVHIRYPRIGWQRAARIDADSPFENIVNTLQWVESNAAA